MLNLFLFFLLVVLIACAIYVCARALNVLING